MKDSEIDAAIKEVWPFYEANKSVSYERNIFRAGMRHAAKICELHVSFMEGVADQVAKRECASLIRKAAR